MAWVAVDKDGREWTFTIQPQRSAFGDYWEMMSPAGYCELPQTSIRKLIGRKLTWEDEPVEIS